MQFRSGGLEAGELGRDIKLSGRPGRSGGFSTKGKGGVLSQHIALKTYSTCHEGLRKMTNSNLEKSEMSIGAFTADALRTHIAPPSSGVNVKDRIRVAARKLGWSYTRTKDVWYADPRISISGDELRDIEEAAGVTYGRAEARSLEQLIAKADLLLDGQDPDFYRPFRDAFRSFFRAVAGARTPGE